MKCAILSIAPHVGGMAVGNRQVLILIDNRFQWEERDNK